VHRDIPDYFPSGMMEKRKNYCHNTRKCRSTQSKCFEGYSMKTRVYSDGWDANNFDIY